MQIIYKAMPCLSFFQQVDSHGYILKKTDLNKYTSNSSKGCVLKVDLEQQNKFITS